MRQDKSEISMVPANYRILQNMSCSLRDVTLYILYTAQHGVLNGLIHSIKITSQIHIQHTSETWLSSRKTKLLIYAAVF